MSLFKKYFRQNMEKKWRFWLKSLLLKQRNDHNIGFQEKRQFLGDIAK
jgi:hypothetical protein